MLCLRMKLELSLATYYRRKIEKFNNKMAQNWFHRTFDTVSKADADRGGVSDVITRDVTEMRVEFATETLTVSIWRGVLS